MLSIKPPYSKLAYQLAPAALVSAVGIVLLSSLAKPSFAPPQATTPAAVAMKTEAVFTPTPRPAAPAEPAQVAEQPEAPPVAARPAAKPKPAVRKLATSDVPLPAPRQPAPAAAPLPIEPAVAAAPPAPPANEDRGVLARLRGVTTSVTSLPGRAYSQVTGWFAYDAPPRPPAEVPAQNFKATM